jgi:hypothetical protein
MLSSSGPAVARDTAGAIIPRLGVAGECLADLVVPQHGKKFRRM